MEVGREHPLVWTEQLMPVLPLVRMPTVDEAIDFAVIVERGCRHSAMIHSTTLKNSPGGEGDELFAFYQERSLYAGLAQGAPDTPRSP
jgi:propionaldehyde dehydrogenase